jgi:DNA-binding protein Fis
LTGALTGAVSSTDLEDIERATIERVFEQVKGDKALAGKMLGISRATLYRKLKRYTSAAVRRWHQAPSRRCNSGRCFSPLL